MRATRKAGTSCRKSVKHWRGGSRKLDGGERRVAERTMFNSERNVEVSKTYTSLSLLLKSSLLKEEIEWSKFIVDSTVRVRFCSKDLTRSPKNKKEDAQ